MVKNRRLFIFSQLAVSLAILIFAITNYDAIANGLSDIFEDGRILFSTIMSFAFLLHPLLGLFVFLVLSIFSIRRIFIVLYLAITFIIVIFSYRSIKRLFESDTKERTYDYLKRTLASNNSRSFATDTEDLISKIVDGKISKEDKKIIKDLIQPKINKIASFIRGDESKDPVLLVDGSWGSGKTTAVMLGLEKGDRNNFRYIYSSAFKYTPATNEFDRDIVASIFSTLEKAGFNIDKGAAKALLSNIDSRPTKFLASLLPENDSENMVTPELVNKINEIYKASLTEIKIIIIIDDIDRLQGEDVLKTLSLVSILRKFSFVKIIIPADLKAVKAMLKEAKVYLPDIFIEKYLPENTAVEILYGREFVGKVVISKIIAAQTKKLAPGSYNPAWAAILMGLISKKLEKAISGTKYEARSWVRNYDLVNAGDKEIPNLLKIIFAARGTITKAWPKEPTHNTHGYPIASKYDWNIGNTDRLFSGAITAQVDKELDIKIVEQFSDDYYNDAVRSWIFDYANRNWRILGITMRDALDFVNGLELGNLSEYPGEQFAEMFNRVFGKKITMLNNKKKPGNK